MTKGQIAQLRELDKCYIVNRVDYGFIQFALWDFRYFSLNKKGKATLRRLWHQYRHQIAAMRKNRK